jgi:hypothetical protein
MDCSKNFCCRMTGHAPLRNVNIRDLLAFDPHDCWADAATAILRPGPPC